MNGGFAETFYAIDFPRWRERSLQATEADVDRALARRGRCAAQHGLEDFCALLSPTAMARIEELAQHAHRCTVQRFGRVLQMYAPLYLSNECIDECTYCGFSRENPIHRVTLDGAKVFREARHLLGEGFRHVLLVSGEHPRLVSTGYLEEQIRGLRPHFASISVEVAPQSTEAYRQLVRAGLDGVSVYQETYDTESYARHHLSGRKKNFDWRLATPERASAAGVGHIGIGALLGLSEPLHDMLATFVHASWCQRRLWRSSFSVSVPRLRAAAGAIDAPYELSDRSLSQFVCALRLCLPDIGITLSTRERPQLRDGLVRLGVTQLSAGSRTEPGGYGEPDSDAEQFEIADHRSPAQVAARLRALNYEVVWKDWESSLAAVGGPS
jgi:2-iminoacetate synthase